jgi:small GTP-binding protein
MTRYSEDTFSPTVMSTIGVDFKMKTIDVKGKRIKMQIWDTAGQERFYTITSTYYRGAMGVMLVYDVTNKRSFDSVANWMRNIDENAKDDVIKMLLGNKCDMEGSREIAKETGVRVAAVRDGVYGDQCHDEFEHQ